MNKMNGTIEHGGQIHSIARTLGCDPMDLLDFSSSLNPLGPPESMRRLLRDFSLRRLAPYPDSDSRALREGLSSKHGLPSDCFLIGNGSCELIFLIPRAMRPLRAAVIGPTFGEYVRACRLAGAEIRLLGMDIARAERWYAHGQGLDTVAESDVCFLCNPNNPSGNILPRDAWREIIGAHPRTLFVADEAFIDFLPQPEQESWINWIAQHGNLIVLRSFTKFYAIAGLRLGYAVAQPSLLQRVQACKEPWTVNVLAQEAGLQLLQEGDFDKRSRQWLAIERPHFAECLEQTGLLQVYPSSANYVLARLRDEAISSGDFCRSLWSQKIVLRDAASFEGLDNRHVRIAVKDRQANDALVSALRNEEMRGQDTRSLISGKR